MIRFHPNNYHDELVYSIMARYHQMSPNSSNSQTITDLFGTKITYSFAELPLNLKYFSQCLKLHFDDVVYNHTMFPLYAPFMSKEKITAIYQRMIGECDSSRRVDSGIYQCGIPYTRTLKYCPICKNEAEEQIGIAYWKRTHQVFGVKICPIHKVWLCDSGITVPNKRKFLDLQVLPQNIIQQKIKEDDIDFHSCLAISEGLHTLLNNRFPHLYCNELKRRYMILLQQRGMALDNERVKTKQLCEELQLFYGEGFLKKMYCDFQSGYRHSWVDRLLHGRGAFFHPIQHLLLIHFLEEDVVNFFRKKNEEIQYIPYGLGPWHCLNPVCTFYKQKIIPTCSLKQKKDWWYPIGTFQCICGYTYSRKKPIQDEMDRNEITVLKYGDEWEKKLYLMITKEKISIKKAAKNLAVTPLTVSRYIKKQEVTVVEQKISDEFVKLHQREKWKKLIEKYPNLTREQLRRCSKGAHIWLYRNDRKWLEENSPTVKKGTSKLERIDWKKRDALLSEKVEEAVKHIKNRKGKFQRVTITTIAKYIDGYSYIPKYLSKLPRTKKIIEQYIETDKEYLYRKRERKM
ncbi:TnsD family Tn7-like transposition protein [Bacillus cereus]|uniref:TnsD family Tn7-like transposition protein n=1 Tax=Bacillus cereus TaxID=1396 RepID=UPI0013FE026D|nr:TnsD family Tn7-like transposition protein [Bacillus cereus]